MDTFTDKTSFTQWLALFFLYYLMKWWIVQLDCYTKKLYMAPSMKLLLFAQLHATESLRALSYAFFLDDLQEALGFESISFSQLERTLNEVPTSFFEMIFLDLVAQIHEKTNFQKRRRTFTPWMLIDSTTLPLNLTILKWVEFRKTKPGVKLHLRLTFMEKGLSYPDKAVLTNVIEHDLRQLEVFVDDKEYLYVFDCGYLEYKRFDLTTDEIADVYKSRWAIELFFK